MLDSILDALKIHGPIGAVILAMGYVGQLHIRRDQVRQKLLERRISDLEQDRVTKHDLERVYDRIEAVSTQIQTNQNTLLGVLTRTSDQSRD